MFSPFKEQQGGPCGLEERVSQRGEGGPGKSEVIGGQIMQIIVGCCKDFDFYLERDGKPLESLVFCCGMNLFTFLKNQWLLFGEVILRE